MSAATAQPVASIPAKPLRPRLVLALLGVLAALGVALRVASLVPGSVVVGRLSAEARSGPYTQDLATYFDQRLRFGAGLLLALVVGLYVVRGGLFELLTAGARWRPAALRAAWVTVLSIGVALVVGAAIRLVFVGQPMRYDEALTFNEFASRP